MSLWGDVLAPDDSFNLFVQFFIVSKIRSTSRIGPHNLDVLSVIFGTMLGDAHAETRKGSTRICFQQENSHAQYLGWLHQFFAKRGYTNPEKPKLLIRIVKKGKKRFYFKFKTWSFQSFNWIEESFYINNVKVVPADYFLYQYLTPLALAIWIMDGGTRNGYGLSLETNSFSKKDLERLQKILIKKYGLKTSLHKTGVENQLSVYVWSESMPTLRKLVQSYLVECGIQYKLGISKK